MEIATASRVRDLSNAIIKHASKLPTVKERVQLLAMLRQSLISGDYSPMMKLGLMTRNPVNIRTFIQDRDFLDLKAEIFPRILEELEELNSGRYVEAVLTGAIGTAKTTMALITQAYQLYLLSCYSRPQVLYGLIQTDEILFIFQSLREKLARAVDYERFKAMIDRSEYFKQEFRYDRNYTSEMKFPHRIIVKPVSGLETAAIGQNVFGGMMDEVNFMEVTEKSMKATDGGSYDQAVALYNSLSRRRKSRFMKQGALPGILCLVSSKRYPGQFTDKKIEEAHDEIKRYGKTTIFVYDKRTWEVLPKERFSGKWFHVFIGDQHRKPRLLEPNEEVPDTDRHLIMAIPEEYRSDFERDIMNALRDIGGVSTLARFPFMIDVEKVDKCFGTAPQILSRTDVDFTTTKLMFYPKRFKNPQMPRWAHIDLAISGDSAGLAIGHVDRFVKLPRGEDVIETLPHVQLDCTLEVRPPQGGEIKFFKIRELLYKLRAAGLNIKWVTLDSYQSTDTLQLLRQKGFVTGMQSMDTTTLPYEITKTAFYDGRVDAPKHDLAVRELVSLERDPKKGKIDHPPHGSKDVADAIAGVVYGLTMRREIWTMHGVNVIEMPMSIQQIVVRAKENMKDESGQGGGEG